MSYISFFVPGIPQQKGSFRPVSLPNGKPVLVPMNAKAKPWQAMVHGAAMMHCETPLQGPVRVDLRFHLPRPATLPKERLGWPAGSRGDLDKHVRSVLDGLTGVAFVDDGQVCEVLASKHYSIAPGVQVDVYGLPCTHGETLRNGTCRYCGFAWDHPLADQGSRGELVMARSVPIPGNLPGAEGREP